MIIFIDVKKDCTEFHSIDGVISNAPPITDCDNFKLSLATQSSEAATHNLYPNFFIDAGYMTQEVIEFVETCGIPNVYAIKLSHIAGTKVSKDDVESDLRIIATSGKQQRAAGEGTDSNTLTMRLIQHSIKQTQDRLTPQPAHQETTDRINALAYALGALNDSIGTIPASMEHAYSIDNARFAIADELRLLTANKAILKDSQAAPQPPKAPTPPEVRIINESRPQDQSHD